MPETRYYPPPKDEQKTPSSSSRAGESSSSTAGDQRDLTFDYNLHYTGPVSVERAAELLAQEAEDMKRNHSRHGYDRDRDSQFQSHSRRNSADHGHSDERSRIQRYTYRTIEDPRYPRHNNDCEKHHERCRRKIQAHQSSQSHGHDCDPSGIHKHGASSSTSETVCDETFDCEKHEHPLRMTELPLPRVERRGPNLYIIREAHGRRHTPPRIPDGGTRTSCTIL